MSGLLALVASVVLAQAVPPRDAQATRATGTAIVRGRITSAASRQPLHRVRVTLSGQNPNPPTAVTDTRGEFEFTSVPAGTYRITAARAGYLTVQYGQRRPREAGRRVEVSDGQVIEQLEMALHRGGVLDGAITDDLGDPYPGVRVEAVEVRYVRGRRIPVQAASTSTNDLGQFRLTGLEPGTYFLRASTTETWESDDGKETFAYVPTYLPGVTSTNEAQRVSVSVGQTLSNLNFRVLAGRAARITGVMQNATGEPMASQAINLSLATRGVGGALFSTQAAGSARTDRSGAFEFQNLAPGEYVVSSGSEAEGVSLTVTVSDGDVRNVVLSPRNRGAVTGSVVTDEGAAVPFPAARLVVTPIPADPESVLPSFTAPRAAGVNADWTFRIGNIDGQYLFRTTGMPDDWMLKSVLLDRRDVTDAPLNVPAGGVDTSGLQIVLTRKGAKVSGQVVDRDGAPAPDSTVIVFAADSAKWTLASRFVRAARPDDTGRFSITGLPAGAYRAVAKEFVADGQWEDPEFLNSLTRESVRFELAEGGSETLTLKLEPPR